MFIFLIIEIPDIDNSDGENEIGNEKAGDISVVNG